MPIFERGFHQASDTGHGCHHAELVLDLSGEDQNAIRCASCGKRWVPRRTPRSTLARYTGRAEPCPQCSAAPPEGEER